MQQFCYKMQQLLQIATTLLQNGIVSTKCDSSLSHSEKADQKPRMFEKVL